MANNIDTTWSLDDTFNNWLIKYNRAQEILKSINDTLEELGFAFVNSEFTYSGQTEDSLTVEIKSGRVRYGSSVETIADTDLTLEANKTFVVGIHKQGTFPSFLSAFELSEVPEELFVPLYQFVMNDTAVESVQDLRTKFSYDIGTNSGGGSDGGPIMLFDKLITQNTLIPVGKNALSVAPTVASGVTVTVSEDSEWVVL